MMNKTRIVVFFVVVGMACVAFAENTDQNTDVNNPCKKVARFTFSWQFQDACNLKPRGGVSKGAPVTLKETPTEGWVALQQSGITKKERDRLAILAMAGPYRVSFDFLEIMGFSSAFAPDQPYQSWGTEYVYVIEDTQDLISLQHVMVMYLLLEGKKTGPYVMKHWRQDWEFEKEELFVYGGRNSWRKVKVDTKALEGSWAQSVFQVDDSPRYESYGYWEHHPGFSTWRSQLTSRPLPRREFSQRDDYDLLEGYNRHTIVPNGWVQEEENHKLVLDEEGLPDADLPYLSKELGIARYEAITGHDFSPGDAYWRATEYFWRSVREEWHKRIKVLDAAIISKTIEDTSLFEVMFSYAAEYEEGALSDDDVAGIIAEILNQILEDNPEN